MPFFFSRDSVIMSFIYISYSAATVCYVVFQSLPYTPIFIPGYSGRNQLAFDCPHSLVPQCCVQLLPSYYAGLLSESHSRHVSLSFAMSRTWKVHQRASH